MKYKDKSTLTNISINEIDGVKFSLEREREQALPPFTVLPDQKN
jgi:hypothetical protein